MMGRTSRVTVEIEKLDTAEMRVLSGNSEFHIMQVEGGGYRVYPEPDASPLVFAPSIYDSFAEALGTAVEYCLES